MKISLRAVADSDFARVLFSTSLPLFLFGFTGVLVADWVERSLYRVLPESLSLSLSLWPKIGRSIQSHTRMEWYGLGTASLPSL